jgi:2-polyprenyl-3-methyl-5-hydroxy-6-metoxy-1,4-benzoquinol methylase
MTTAIANPLEINRAYYRTHADDFRERTESLPMDSVYTPFLKLLPLRARILDAGCGSGRDAVAFQSRGHHVTCIDASPEMVRVAKRHGLDAEVMTFQRMTFKGEFDGIWACASVLHVPHAEVPGVLRRFAKSLKPDGVLYVSLKEGHGERIAEDGRFFSYFTLAEFSRSLTSEGLFELIESWKTDSPDSSGTMRSWLNFLARKSD